MLVKVSLHRGLILPCPTGHLAPMDLPGPSLDMIKRFIHDESFADVPLPSEGTSLSVRLTALTLCPASYATLLVEESQDSHGIDDTVPRDDGEGDTPPAQMMKQQRSSPAAAPENFETPSSSTSSGLSLLLKGRIRESTPHPQLP
jgi:hypothetical protein